MTTIYKVCGAGEWSAAQGPGQYDGSADDRRDGFIHFSTASQLAATLARHFAGRGDLVLIAVDADGLDGDGLDGDGLGAALKWEPSRGGDLFPHLYGALPLMAVLWAKPLALAPNGLHILPAGLSE